MDWMQTLKAVFALAIVLGLILGLSALLRRYGPQFMAQMSSRPGRKRRLSVVETLVLDPARRLVLVRIDDRERLLLLGEGRDLGADAATDPAPLPARRTAPVPAPDDELF